MWRRVTFSVIAMLCYIIAGVIFLSSFTVTITQVGNNSGAADSLAASCSPPYKQLVSEPAPTGSSRNETNPQQVAFTNAQPLCRDVARSRSLAALGFFAAGLLALGLAFYRPRAGDTSDPVPDRSEVPSRTSL